MRLFVPFGVQRSNGEVFPDLVPDSVYGVAPLFPVGVCFGFSEQFLESFKGSIGDDYVLSPGGDSVLNRGSGSGSTTIPFPWEMVFVDFASSEIVVGGGFSGCPKMLPCRRLWTGLVKWFCFVFVLGEAVGDSIYEVLRAGFGKVGSWQLR